jgi:pyruvate ferredoxin oxidoreductase beta subunit
MSAEVVKFYQTGSLAVGNRLLAPSQRTVQADVGRLNAITSGHRA